MLSFVAKAAKRTRKLQALATPDEVDAFLRACSLLGVHAPDTLRALARAFAAHVAERKSVRLPLSIEIK